MEISQITSKIDFPHYYAEKGLINIEDKIRHLTIATKFPGFDKNEILTQQEKLHSLEQYIINLHL